MRRPTPRAKPKTTIDYEDHVWSGIYGELIERYENAPPVWMVVMTAVRCYGRRYGMEGLLTALKMRGVPWTAERCRHEMHLREEFFVRMISDHPPDNRDDIDKACEEIAFDLALLDRPEGGLLLLRYLDRLLQRELALSLSDTVVH